MLAWQCLISLSSNLKWIYALDIMRHVYLISWSHFPFIEPNMDVLYALDIAMYSLVGQAKLIQ